MRVLPMISSKKISFFWFIVSVLFTFQMVFASKPRVQLAMEFGRFRYDSSSVYLEIYYTASATGIEYQKTENGEEATTTLNFSLLNAQNDSVLASDNILIHFNKPDTITNDVAQASMGIIKLVVPPGKYKLRLASVSDTLAYDVPVGIFDGDKITLSDLELCSNIITHVQDKNDPYYKNTMKVIPNPTSVYGVNFPRLYYYIEMYNVDKGNVKPEDEIFIQVVIADTDGNIRLKKEYKRNHKYRSLVERGAFNVGRLENGLYTLIFAVTDSANNVAMYRRRNFYIYNPNVVLASADESGETYEQSEFSTMSEKQLDLMFDQARYVATNSEVNVYKVLNSVESKRQFMFKFWKERNKENPGWKDTYYERVAKANELFSVSNIPGWRTDMGRVYILYGPPDQRERHPFQPDENPYEVWFYHELEGGVEFDFVDMSGMGNYKLVNSTKRGEISYPNWIEYVYSR